MAEEAEWAAYFYPGTTVLRNKLDIRDPERLEQAERFLVARRSEQIRSGAIAIARTFDGDHLKAIHRALTVDVWPFAGLARDVSIGKRTEDGEPARWFLPPVHIDTWLEEVAATVAAVDWPKLPRAELVTQIAQLHTYLNFGHVFREANGRSLRIFLEHVVETTPFALDFDRVDQDEWLRASRDSIHPGRSYPPGGPLVFEPQERVFDKIVVDRPAARPSEASSAARLAQLGTALPASRATSSSTAPTSTPRTSHKPPETTLER